MTSSGSWLDGLAEGVVLIEGDRVQWINAAAARLLGAEPAWAVGKRLITVVRDHRLEQVWSQGKETEVTLAGRSIRAVPLPGGLALRDLSDMREARESSKALLRVLSHELRTPITTVRSTLEALAFEDLPAAERSRLLERAIGEVDRLVRLLDDLTRDVTPPRERSISLSSILERAELILTGTLEERSVTVRHEVGETSLWADPDKVLQVLLNLIENAARHGPSDAEIEVTAEPRQGWIEIVVRDQGEPLEAGPAALSEEGQRLPDPKGRVNGLGLLVVRSIAEAWGGRAWWRAWRKGEREGNEFGVLVPGSRDAARERVSAAE